MAEVIIPITGYEKGVEIFSRVSNLPPRKYKESKSPRDIILKK